MKNWKKFDPSKLIVKREEAMYPNTYYIKKKYAKNSNEDSEFIAATDTITMLLTHWILINKLESPATKVIEIGISKNIGRNTMNNKKRNILNSIEESINEDDLYITSDFVEKYFNILGHIISGFATGEPYCIKLYNNICRKLQTNGYDVEYDFDKNSMLIHIVFGNIEEESSDVKESVAQYDTDMSSSSTINY